MWHGTVTYQGGQYHFAWVGNSGKSRNQIYYSVSTDGCQFSCPQVLIENDAGWDYLYRPCLLMEGGRWHCYYGVIRCDGKWMISMSRGVSLKDMAGITADDLGVLGQPLRELIASDTKMRIRRKIKDTASLFTPRLIMLVPIMILLRFLQFSPLAVWFLSVIGSIACAFLIIGSKWAIRRGMVMGTVTACVTVFLTEVVSQVWQILLTLIF